MDKYKTLKDLVASIEPDVIKFYTKENKAAGLRIRKVLQVIKKAAQELREDTAPRNNKDDDNGFD